MNFHRRTFLKALGTGIPAVMLPLVSGAEESTGTVVSQVPDLDLVKELLKKKEPNIWLFTGDSITHGGGAISYSPADWPYDYQTHLNFPSYNLGRSGDTAETSAARFDADVLPFQPRFLIIMTGINSLRAGAAAEDVIEDLQSIKEKCLTHGIRPIFLTLPPINPSAIRRTFGETTAPNWQQELREVNAFIRRQPYSIDLYPYFADTRGELPERFAIDGLHYDISGKKLMAAIINRHWESVTK